MNTQWLSAAAVLLGLALAEPALAERQYDPGVTNSEIKIGQTMPYSGPVSALGTIGRAEAAYFRMINDQGGINGRKLLLISRDDAYWPPKTVELTRELVEREEVLLIFSAFGTATNAAIQRYLNLRGVPQLFVVSGATRWGDPEHFPWTMGFQPTLQTEGRIIGRYLAQSRPRAKIGVLYQNDDFGRDYLKGLRDGLDAKAATMIVGELAYENTDATVYSQILALQAAGADVLVDVSTPKFTAQSIRKVSEVGWKPLHVVYSGSTGRSEVLEPAGLENAAGLVSAQWHKDPTDPHWANDAATKHWLRWMSQYYPAGDRTSVFNVAGYSWAMALVQVLRQWGDDLTRKNVMRQAAHLDIALPMALPGIRLSTGPEQFFPLRDMQLMRFNGNFWQGLGELVRAE